MLVKVKAPFRFPNGDGVWEEALADAEVHLPDDQVDSLVAQGFVAKLKGKAEKASVVTGQ